MAVTDAVLEALLEKREAWKIKKRRTPFWAFFENVGFTPLDKNGRRTEILRCFLCSDDDTGSVDEPTFSSSSSSGKGIYHYSHKHGTSNLKKHVESEHAELLERLLQQDVSSETENGTQWLQKRGREGLQNDYIQVTRAKKAIPNEYYSTDSSKQRTFVEDLALLVCKGSLPFSLADNPWLHRLVSHLDPKVKPICRKTLVETVIPEMANHITNNHLKPLLHMTSSGSLSIDLWMSRSGEDVFGLVWTFMDPFFRFKEITLGLVKTESTAGTDLMKDMKAKLEEFGLVDKLLCIVKDGGANLRTCTSAILGLVSNPFLDNTTLVSPCLAHVASNACTNATKASILLKEAKACMQKCITYTKKVLR